MTFLLEERETERGRAAVYHAKRKAPVVLGTTGANRKALGIPLNNLALFYDSFITSRSPCPGEGTRRPL